MSAASLPAAGPMPKPWPEKPVARKKPGMASTDEMTGMVSGVQSIVPPQASAISMSFNSGFDLISEASAALTSDMSGAGSRTRSVSNGDGLSKLQLVPRMSWSKKDLPNDSFN